MRDCGPACNIKPWLVFFLLLLNRQRKNSTGNASHHIPLWWMCWPRPCTSFSQPQTVSLFCLCIVIIITMKHFISRWQWFWFSSCSCGCLLLTRFSPWAEESLFPIFQTGRRVHCWTYWTPLSVSINDIFGEIAWKLSKISTISLYLFNARWTTLV